MRKIKEVLRLKLHLGLTEREVARSCSMARSTVSQYVERAKEAGLTWPLPEEWDDGQIENRLFPRMAGSVGQGRPQPDFNAIHNELKRHKSVTLQLQWEEYKESNPDGYQRSHFSELYRVWAKKLDLVLRHPHRAGEKLFVDYAGPKVPIVDPKTGNTNAASIFVAVMGASNYTYAEATMRQDLMSWISSHVRAFEFLGGCPCVVVPDNPKVGVIRPCWYEPEINPTYAEMAAHYGVAVIPARPRKPKDKAKVEAGVLLVERWILAALRNRTFFTIEELNEAIARLLQRLNSRRFRKLPGCRAELFASLDRPALQALPTERYSFAEWKRAKVNIDYHVELDRHFYSVPYALVGRQVELRYTSTTVEIIHKGVRVASHPRGYQPGAATTVNEHRPPGHQEYLSWTPTRLLEWASRASSATHAVAMAIMESYRYPEQGFRSCLGLMRLGSRFGQQRLEAACARALKFQACSYRSVKRILETGADRIVDSEPEPAPMPLLHENIRGACYFEGGREDGHVG
jgi:transposase